MDTAVEIDVRQTAHPKPSRLRQLAVPEIGTHLRYLITFSCYGAHLHGHENGSVDRLHNIPGHPFLEPNPQRERSERRLMTSQPQILDAVDRETVLASIRETCTYRNWKLLAAHVRTTHVHIVVESDIQPERMMGVFKPKP